MHNHSAQPKKTILWWGRFDPEYSRNRLIRRLLVAAGYRLADFRPRSSFLGGLEAAFSGIPRPDAVWVGAFRQSDFASARRFANRHTLPLIFDPLISAWDKAVFERSKFPESSWRAQRLQRRERNMFQRADLVLADTELHARFFIDVLASPPEKTVVVPVGAEETLFFEQPWHDERNQLEVLFYGSFIHLQGPDVIIEAAKLVPEVRWTMLGSGPLRKACEEQAAGCSHIVFENWCPYDKLAARIGRANILLGVFGTSAKAGRVIPNKAYQALACGRPLITRESGAYPAELRHDPDSGIVFIPAGDAGSLAAAVRRLVNRSDQLPVLGGKARASFDCWFSEKRIGEALASALTECLGDSH